MVHILFDNTLYLAVTSNYKGVAVRNKNIVFFSKDGQDDLTIDVQCHPTVQAILDSVATEQREETLTAILYQTFNLICQRFTGKALVDGKLVPIENDILNLDGALSTLEINPTEASSVEDKKDEKVN